MRNKNWKGFHAKTVALLFIVITTYSCASKTQTLPKRTETVSPVSDIATNTIVSNSPTIPANPPQQISTNNFSRLFEYNNITFPEEISRIMWLSRGLRLGILANDMVYMYDVPSFSQNGKMILPKRRSIYETVYLDAFGDVMLINQGGDLVLWDLFKNKSIQKYPWLDTDLISAKMSPTTNLIAISGIQIQEQTRIIEIIDLEGKELQRFVGHKNDAPILDWSADEKYLVSSAIGRDTNQNQILLWDISSGKLLYSLPDLTVDFGIAKFNHRGDKIAVASSNAIRIWNIISRSWISNEWEYDIEESYINSLSFALSDDLIIANTSKNKTLFINAQTGELIELPEKSKNVIGAILSPDNLYLAVLYDNRTISIWGNMEK